MNEYHMLIIISSWFCIHGIGMRLCVFGTTPESSTAPSRIWSVPMDERKITRLEESIVKMGDVLVQSLQRNFLIVILPLQKGQFLKNNMENPLELMISGLAYISTHLHTEQHHNVFIEYVILYQGSILIRQSWLIITPLMNCKWKK